MITYELETVTTVGSRKRRSFENLLLRSRRNAAIAGLDNLMEKIGNATNTAVANNDAAANVTTGQPIEITQKFSPPVLDTDACHDNPCSNGGSCADLPGQVNTAAGRSCNCDNTDYGDIHQVQG